MASSKLQGISKRSTTLVPAAGFLVCMLVVAVTRQGATIVSGDRFASLFTALAS